MTLIFAITVEGTKPIPAHVRQWMADNLAEYVENEFGRAFEPTWVEPEWAGRPIPDGAHAAVRCDELRPKFCDHKFIDSTACLKCGWTPGPSELR